VTQTPRFFRTFWPLVAEPITAHRANTRREVRGVLDLVPLRPRARILDVPCGFGRHSIELARKGFRVTGVDICSKLLKEARRNAAARGVPVQFRCTDMRKLAYRNRFDAVLSLFTSFGYYGDAGDLRLLRTLRRALRPRGSLILHLVNRDWVMRNFQPRERVRMSNFVFSEERKVDFSQSVITSRMTLRRGRWVRQGTIRLRLYSCHELVRMLKQARFSKVKYFGDITGATLGPGSRWLVLVARR